MRFNKWSWRDLALLLLALAFMVGVAIFLGSLRKDCVEEHRAKGMSEARAQDACRPPPGGF